MKQTECVAMLLAGGEGSRLKALTANVAKPAVHFGGKYRIIDFALSNCANSGIDTVGVLTQYQPLALGSHLGVGTPWDLHHDRGGLTVLPPYMEKKEMKWYTGTANAVYQNLNYLDSCNPEHVLILSGDHIYNMDYRALIDRHKETGADVTISVIGVKWDEASRFGIMSTDDRNRVTEFVEKPAQPKSNLASMGIYVFKWDVLRTYLLRDEQMPGSTHDFGKDVIPAMLANDVKLYAYPFEGYWRDVGTIESLWDAHMDLLGDEPEFRLNSKAWPLYTANQNRAPQYIGGPASVSNSLLSEGCQIFGDVDSSVLSYGVQVGQGSLIRNSVIMPNVKIGENVQIHNAIIGEGTIIADGDMIGNSQQVSLFCKEDLNPVEKDNTIVFTSREKQLLHLLERIG
ncbi:glucose-1-phosphate adenylyltransferase [Paenibacillus swuensis]|uniref:Glucose-1-phosphate adenylyltransferase n=1 Tax=Paenibacillus swuensis TaxID=1178515 RepID=A0A172TM23_9BACL|nr:glucose-1-phosphate adenylyltransferase [Paenibacillus swuensis]ANE48105.1 glucose-1-phosphate adenylyltransferase [Paenibacillus swuensis]